MFRGDFSLNALSLDGANRKTSLEMIGATRRRRPLEAINELTGTDVNKSNSTPRERACCAGCGQRPTGRTFNSGATAHV